MDEEALVRAILARIGGGPARGVRVGPGDDAAVLRTTPGADLVVTTDALVERVHFDLGLQDAAAVGHKLVEVNLSDLAAMGASPRWLVVAVQVKEGGAAVARTVLDATAARCTARGIGYVGGNVSSGAATAFTGTALGEIAGAPLRRAGARPGDRLWITGPTGLAATGLAALRAGRAGDSGLSEAIERFLRPVAHVETGAWLPGLATAAIDVSDGLVLDASRLCEASGVGARLRLPDVPFATRTAALAGELGLDADAAIAAGGEDYELLVAVPSGGDQRASELGLVRIGEVTEGGALEVVSLDGSPYAGPKGFVHGT